MAMRVGELDVPLLRLNPWDNFTLRDACQGVCVMGGIGGGKTTADVPQRRDPGWSIDDHPRASAASQQFDQGHNFDR